MDTYTTVSFNLFPYRNLPATSRAKIFLFETASATHFFKGAVDYLRHYQGDTEPETPPIFITSAEKLSKIGTDLRDILNEIEFKKQDKQMLIKVGSQVDDLMDQITNVIEEFQQEEPKWQKDHLELSLWLSNIKNNAEIIQAAAHTLLDKNSVLPIHLSYWAINRQEIIQKAKTGDQAVKPILLKTLENPEPFIRREAVELFEHFDATFDLEPLTNLLSDSSEEVRQATAQTLGELGSQQAIKPLANALDVIGFPAAVALFKLGDPLGRSYLLEQLERSDFAQKHVTIRLFLDDLKQLWNQQNVHNAANDSDVAKNQALAQEIIDRLKSFEPYFAPYSYELCNELRHYYGAISERKSMEYANVILENNIMDRYIIHILGDWYLDRRYEWFDQEKGIQTLLSKASTYSDLYFLEIACLLEAANVLSDLGEVDRARDLFLEIINRNNSDNVQALSNYQRFAWRRLKIINNRLS